MFVFTALPPLSLYVHIPWCVRKCPYCDFNSHSAPDQLPEAAYIDALIADLEQDLPGVWGRPVESIFIGGGTPSLLTPASIDRLLSQLRARLPLRAGLEITLEANPGTWEAAKFADFRAAGVNRLSLGIQSFNADHLTRIGRIHGAREALYAVEGAQHVGFENVNVDLMFGLPSQTVAQACADVQQAISLAVTHISHYQLTLEPNTAFYHTPPVLPDDDETWEMQEQCQALLAAHGYHHYEVSAYAQPGYECKHNLNYWHFGDYLGIGAGAHAKISDASQQKIRRTSKVRHPQAYLTHAATAQRVAESHALSRADAAFEFMLNALRLTDGVPSAEFTAHTGLPLTVVEKPLREAERRGWIAWDMHALRPTPLGRRFLNDLLQLFLP